MTGVDWRALGLQARIAAGRLSPVWVLAVLCLALGAVTWLGGAGRQEATLEALRQALTQRHAQLRAPVAAAPTLGAAQQGLVAFHAALGEASAVERYVGLLFQAAEAHGIALTQAEYRWKVDRNGPTDRYQIRLPLKGEYAQLRGFCDQVLIDMPFAAIDELSFKRDAVSDEAVSASLQISLHLHAAAIDLASVGARP